MSALLKLNEIERLLKMGAFLIMEHLFNDWVSEGKQGEGKAAKEVLGRFLI